MLIAWTRPTAQMTTKVISNSTKLVFFYFEGFAKLHDKLEGKYSLESTDPRESEIRAHLRP